MQRTNIYTVFRTVLHFMRAKNLQKLRNLYVQLDNYSINKNYTMIGVMEVLTLLGIVRKVKLAYLKRCVSELKYWLYAYYYCIQEILTTMLILILE